MGRRGPPPKPTHLKLLAGNPGKRKINRREPKPKAGASQPPAYLGARAKVEWRRLVKVMPFGMLTQADRQLMALYCQNEARIEELEKLVTEHSYTFITDKGYVAQRPEVGILNKVQQTQIRICGELGLSPSSRTRIEWVTPDAPGKGGQGDDDDETFIFGSRAGPT